MSLTFLFLALVFVPTITCKMGPFVNNETIEGLTDQRTKIEVRKTGEVSDGHQVALCWLSNLFALETQKKNWLPLLIPLAQTTEILYVVGMHRQKCNEMPFVSTAHSLL